MTGVLFDVNGDKGLKHHKCDHDGTWAIEVVQDVAPYLKANKAMYNANSVNKFAKGQDAVLGRHKASIPMVIWHAWQQEFRKMKGLTHPPKINDPEWKQYVSAKLRDRDNRFLRVDGGRD